MRKHPWYLSIATILAVLSGLSLTMIDTQAAPGTSEQEAMQAATSYFNAVQDGDAEKAVQFVHDIRFEDRETLLRAYKQMMKGDPIYHIKVLSVKSSEPEKVVLHVEYESKKQGVQQADLPIIKGNNGWMFEFTEIREVSPKK